MKNTKNYNLPTIQEVIEALELSERIADSWVTHSYSKMFRMDYQNESNVSRLFVHIVSQCDSIVELNHEDFQQVAQVLLVAATRLSVDWNIARNLGESHKANQIFDYRRKMVRLWIRLEKKNFDRDYPTKFLAWNRAVLSYGIF